MFPVKGPWRITEDLKGGSYRLCHCSDAKLTDKKHASYFTAYPLELINSEPVDGSENQYGQLQHQVGKLLCEAAELKGFKQLKVLHKGVL